MVLDSPHHPALRALYRECVRLGLADASQAGLLRFVTAAVAALRDGRNPCALFAGMVNSRAVLTGENLYVRLEDEDAASRMIKHGTAAPLPKSETEP